MNEITNLKDLSYEEILDMDLEKLAYLFLADFPEHNRDVAKNKGITILGYINGATSRTAGVTSWDSEFEVKCAVYEAYQWLYNKGYIMEYIDKGNWYFVTRAGKEFLEKKKREGLF